MIRRMKIATAFLLALALLFGACNSDGDSGKKNTPTDTDQTPSGTDPTGVDSTVDIDLGNPSPGEYWEYNSASGEITLQDKANVTVGGGTTTARLVIERKAAVTIALSNASIDMSAQEIGPAIDASGATLTLILIGSNTLKGSVGWPGLCSNGSGKVTIQGSGSLTAEGGPGGAGIGGSAERDNGTVDIANGTITAIGGYDAAGIGGGYKGDGGEITISGGSGTATCGVNAMFGVGPGAGIVESTGSFNGYPGGWPLHEGRTYTWPSAGGES